MGEGKKAKVSKQQSIGDLASRGSWLLALGGVLAGAVFVGALWCYQVKNTTISVASPDTNISSMASSGACALKNLNLSSGITDGTAGTQYLHLVLANNGSSACTLT